MNEAIRQVTHVQNIRYDKATERLYIIDQTLLPNEEKEIELRTVEEMIEAIKMLRIRGAPAIGICAGYCMYALARDIDAKDNETFYRKLQIDGELLGAARPTAVNLRWAVGEMLDAAKAHLKDDRAELLEALYRKAVDIHEDDIAKCTAISEYGLSLLKDGDGVLTHCNAGPLATSRYGTGQGPFLLAAERGIHIRVFADETRPLLQGARLTSYELQRAGVDVTLICDNMASMVMKNGWVQACFVGCDRIAANGDFANKIGTSGVAILAKHYGIPVYTLGPTSTIDMNCPDGAHIPIELRDGDEIKNLWYEKPMALPEVKCFNPSFDVTDHELLTGIVTEKGICYPPFNESLAALFKDKKLGGSDMAILESPSACIAAEEGVIAKAVLMPGDPLRAKFVAEHYLENPVCFNTVRNMLGYTGTYKGRKLSVMGHGMGVPSAGLYAHELYNFYGVDTIIRIGSAGGIGEDVKVRDVVLAMGASTNSHFADQYRFPGQLCATADYGLLKDAAAAAERLGVRADVGQVFTSDQFYNDNPEANATYRKFGILAVEMETAGIYWTAQRFGKRALSILTISDHIFTGEALSAQERQDSFHEMMEIALETAWNAAE